MSVARKVSACPQCGSTDFDEIGRVEAGDFGPADPPRDLAIYSCRECWLEFDSEGEAERGERVVSAPTLTEFLLARIAEDEAAARMATNFPWRYHPGVGVQGWREDGLVSKPTPYRVAGQVTGWDGPHIARHDPARVLAECEAKRRIVEWHESWPVLVEAPPEFAAADPRDLSSMTFRMSQQIAWITTQEYRNRFGDEPPSSPMLRALAAVYSDHPDYRDEWKP